jgi:hypothetical protein
VIVRTDLPNALEYFDIDGLFGQESRGQGAEPNPSPRRSAAHWRPLSAVAWRAPGHASIWPGGYLTVPRNYRAPIALSQWPM